MPPSTSSSNRLCVLLSRTMAMHGTLALQQIGVFGMLVDIGFDEGALRDDLQALGPNLIQRALHQRRTGVTAEFRRNFGMNESDDTVRDLVVGRGEMTFDHEFVAMLRRIVDDLSREKSFSRVCRLVRQRLSSRADPDHCLRMIP